MTPSEKTDILKATAMELGFAAVGVAPARTSLQEAQKRFEDWLSAGRQAGMQYMERNTRMRFCPAQLMPGAKRVISLAVSYVPGEADSGEERPFIARYARARDYHKVLRGRCRELSRRMFERLGPFQARVLVDTAPLSERSVAVKAGVGWIGRNGCLIVPGVGSFIALAEIVCDVELKVDASCGGGCGDCRACITACPTGACLGDGTLDCTRCLSYLSIEHRGPVPRDLWDHWGQVLFGCDQCQSVCPHNQVTPAGDTELVGSAASPSLAELLAWKWENWDAFTRGRALRRAPLETFQRNAVLAAGHSGDYGLIEPLRHLAARREELREEIDWAIDRLSSRD